MLKIDSLLTSSTILFILDFFIYTWNKICGTWHKTHDIWHMTGNTQWGMNILTKFQLPSSYDLEKTVFWFGEKYEWMNLVITKVFVEQPSYTGSLKNWHHECYVNFCLTFSSCVWNVILYLSPFFIDLLKKC